MYLNAKNKLFMLFLENLWGHTNNQKKLDKIKNSSTFMNHVKTVKQEINGVCSKKQIKQSYNTVQECNIIQLQNGETKYYDGYENDQAGNDFSEYSKRLLI